MYSSEKMSSPSDDTDDLIIDPLAEELRNIESVITTLSRNIDALNAKFANRQDPPPMYISEYQELTSRLHELEEKKLELTEKIQQNESPEPPEESLEVNFKSLLSTRLLDKINTQFMRTSFIKIVRIFAKKIHFDVPK